MSIYQIHYYLLEEDREGGYLSCWGTLTEEWCVYEREFRCREHRS